MPGTERTGWLLCSYGLQPGADGESVVVWEGSGPSLCVICLGAVRADAAGGGHHVPTKPHLSQSQNQKTHFSDLSGTSLPLGSYASDLQTYSFAAC